MKRHSNSKCKDTTFAADENDRVIAAKGLMNDINKKLTVLIRRTAVLQDLIEATAKIYGDHDICYPDDIEVEYLNDEGAWELMDDDLADFDLADFDLSELYPDLD